MIENNLITWFRECKPNLQKALLHIAEAGAESAKREEEQRKATPTAQVITFKPRAELAKEA